MIAWGGETADHINRHLEVEQYQFKRLQEFKYLGSILTQTNDKLTEIQTILQSGINARYYGLNKLLKARMISKNLKIHLYCTLIRPMVMFGCEMWTLRRSMQSKLMIFERKIFSDRV